MGKKYCLVIIEVPGSHWTQRKYFLSGIIYLSYLLFDKKQSHMTSKYTECGYICYRSKLNSGFHFSPNQVFLWLVEQGENFTKDQINFLSVQKTGNNNILRNGKKTNFRLTYRFCKVSKSSNVNRTFFVLDVTIKIKWTQHCTNSQGKNWQCKNKT